MSSALTGHAASLIEQAMGRARQVAQEAAQEHLRAFEMQMREKVGVDEIALNELYLSFLLVRGQLLYLRRMVKLEERLKEEKSARQRKTVDDEFAAALIGAETNRAAIEIKQSLDSARQQSFGITHYIWEGGDCALCAPNNGQMFEWGG